MAKDREFLGRQQEAVGKEDLEGPDWMLFNALSMLGRVYAQVFLSTLFLRNHWVSSSLCLHLLLWALWGLGQVRGLQPCVGLFEDVSSIFKTSWYKLQIPWCRKIIHDDTRSLAEGRSKCRVKMSQISVFWKEDEWSKDREPLQLVVSVLGIR